jgi:hypothetical protein
MPEVLPLFGTLFKVFRNTAQVLRRVLFEGVNVVVSISFSAILSLENSQKPQRAMSGE